MKLKPDLISEFVHLVRTQKLNHNNHEAIDWQLCERIIYPTIAVHIQRINRISDDWIDKKLNRLYETN